MNATIGVVTALPAEARALAGCPCRRKADGFSYAHVLLKPQVPLWVVQSGMGIQNALAAVDWLLKKGVCVLGSFGVSGGLDPELRSGDVVLADTVMREDNPSTGNRYRSDFERLFSCSPDRTRDFRRGKILTTKVPILRSSDKKALYRHTKALAVDMESAAVACGAAASELPFFAIRVICDPQDVSISEPLYKCIDPHGRPRPIPLIGLILQHPRIISDLIKMKRNFDKALACGPLVRGCLREICINRSLP